MDDAPKRPPAETLTEAIPVADDEISLVTAGSVEPPPLRPRPPPPPEKPMVTSALTPPPVPQEPTFSPTIFHWLETWGRDYFLGRNPTFLSAFLPMLGLALVLFTRWPATNYIFDEQEALLANPYVNATNGLRIVDAIHRDFWGLPPERSVGSYRPIPNFLWRGLWQISHAPFFHSLCNVILHGVNAALLACLVFTWTKRRGLAYLTGFVFVSCAVLTEAVSGIVGIADVLGGLGALLALLALSAPAWAMPFAVFAALLFGLFSKESALVCVPLIPFAALVASPLTHPERPARVLRALLALLASVAAFVLYVELRKRWFPSPLPSDLKIAPAADAPTLKRFAHGFLVWFHQAPLPRDPLNNPLAEADLPHRIAGAMRVYWRGLMQLVFPGTLSGDYSFPQEPVPTEYYSVEIIGGAVMMAFPPLAGVALWIGAMSKERKARAEAVRLADDAAPPRRAARALLIAGAIVLVAGLALVARVVLRKEFLAPTLFTLAPVPPVLLGLGLVVEGLSRLRAPDSPRLPVPIGRAGLVLASLGLLWTVVSFFPHSNIPVVLPTVRAERFWYFPALGTSMIFAVLFAWVHEASTRRRVFWLGPVMVGAFLTVHSIQSYRHSMDYRNDVDFWQATKEAVPSSAKAHLNYSVMKGARGDLPTRLTESKIALALAPRWPMAHIYTGDTLCRMHKADDAWPYYKSGFEIGPNELSLVALALQCLWDEKKLLAHEDELRTIAKAHEGSWIAFLAIDTIQNGAKNGGVAKKYRPRGYNEGPKTTNKDDDEEEEEDDDDASSSSASASASPSASGSPSESAAGSASESAGSASATADAPDDPLPTKTK